MTPTARLHALGQRIWLDNITRALLDGGTLRHYIETLSVTGLTSNPSIFNAAIGAGADYDAAILELTRLRTPAPELFTELALDDLRRAADLFRPLFDASDELDGWVSMEIPPLLATDTAGSIAAARQLYRQAGRHNLMVKIPGTPQGLPAIEESIFAGIPVNVTLLFSPTQYLAAAEAYLRGIGRRIAAGRDPRVASVASLFVSRWDVAVHDAVPVELRNRLGIAVAGSTWRAHEALLDSPRWRTLAAAGARPQRLLWASTGTKDPDAPATLYVDALAVPGTITTLPEQTLLAFAAGDAVGDGMAPDGGDAEAVLARFAVAGIDVDALAARLQREGVAAFVAAWRQLMQRITDTGARLMQAART